MKTLIDASTRRESVKAAAKANLVYVNNEDVGFIRKKEGRGFVYYNTRNQRITNPKQIARIQALVIPPAWRNVWICPSPRGHIQVTGYDQRGRKQYRYHAEWNTARNQNKFSKMDVFAQKLPLIRARVKKDLALKGLPREKILALIVRIMEQTLIRVGNEEYAKENRSYGLTTIRNQHVKVRGSKVIFDFKGKSGKHHHLEVMDKQIAPLVKRCQDLPGQELFGYIDDEGVAHDIKSHDVNAYLKDISGEDITAKDFRTWGGTVCAALYLKDHEKPATKTEIKKMLVQTVARASETLGNTPSICRRYYIHPCVFEAFENGALKRIYVSCRKANTRGLYAEEVFTRQLLRSNQAR